MTVDQVRGQHGIVFCDLGDEEGDEEIGGVSEK